MVGIQWPTQATISHSRLYNGPQTANVPPQGSICLHCHPNAKLGHVYHFRQKKKVSGRDVCHFQPEAFRAGLPFPNLLVAPPRHLAVLQIQVSSLAWVLEQKLPGLVKVCSKCCMGHSTIKYVGILVLTLFSPAYLKFICFTWHLGCKSLTFGDHLIHLFMSFSCIIQSPLTAIPVDRGPRNTGNTDNEPGKYS